MRGKIKEIIKVGLDDSLLLEIYFNLEQSDAQRNSVLISITDDGETILLQGYDKWINKSELETEIYLVDTISHNSQDELLTLIDEEITNIYYGFGRDLIYNLPEIYYLKLTTQHQNFLFLNNGDWLHYVSNEQIDHLLMGNIYDFCWTANYPIFNQSLF